MSRGTDATGIGGWGTGQLMYHKAALPAQHYRFPVEVPGATGIGHTRAATTGRPENNNNNHPICAGHIVGAHNGMLWAHEWSADRFGLKLEHEVDSELLFRVLEHTTDHDARVEMFEKIEGDATIVWLDSHHPDTLYAAAMGGRPAHYIRTKDGRFVVASTVQACLWALDPESLPSEKDAAGKSFYVVDVQGEIPDGEMWTIQGGEITSKVTFAKLDQGYGWSKLDHNRANGSGKAGLSKYGDYAGWWESATGRVTELKPPSGKRSKNRRQASPTHLYDFEDYAGVMDCYEAAMEFLDRGMGTTWHDVRNSTLPLEASDDFDLFAYEKDDADNKVYMVNIGASGIGAGWKPVTRSVVEQALEWAFDDVMRENTHLEAVEQKDAYEEALVLLGGSSDVNNETEGER
jgi:hypothetical protein